MHDFLAGLGQASDDPGHQVTNEEAGQSIRKNQKGPVGLLMIEPLALYML